MPQTSSGTRGADHYVMRELNRSLVLDVLKESGPISRAAIAKSTSLAKPTVSAIVEDLLAADLAREIGMGATTAGGGRPPILLEYNARSQYVAGVHIGVNTTEFVIADGRGVELTRIERRTPRRGSTYILSWVADLVRSAMKRSNLSWDRLVAVGVCVPGLIDLESGTCLLAPNLGWHDVRIRDLLASDLQVPIYVHNTAQATTVAETVEGAAQGADDVVLLYVGSGIGAGVLNHGQLFHGARGTSGELGHCAVPGATGQCSCGKIGCLETVASARAIVDAAEAAVTKRTRSVLTKSRGAITTELVADAAVDGDRVAIDLLAHAGHELGVAASWMVNLFNPEVLVVAGGLVEAGEPLLEPLRRALFENVLPHAAEGLDVRPSILGQNAEVRGAVLLALQYSETYYRVIFQS